MKSCSLKHCTNTASTTFSYFRANKRRYHNRCEDHKPTDAEIQQTLNNINISDVKYGQTCPHCGGSGHLIKFQHVRNGVCFRCGGLGMDVLLLTSNQE